MDFFLQALAAAFNLIISLDIEVYQVVWTSIFISLLATLAAAVISVPLGLLVGLTRFPGKDFLQHSLNTLMALPTVVVGLILYGMLSRRGPAGDWGLLFTPTAMVIGQCILIVPIIWNLSIAAVNGADPRLALTCRSLGATGWQQAWIYLREVRFGFLAAIVMGFGRAIGEVGVAMMLGGNIEGYTRTMTTAIALETSKGEFEFALALGIVLLAVAFTANALLSRFQRHA
ncbi:tungstate transport system permease protein [Methylohalomonas lacus]|uniref:Tungstate transport system permease protein n=1 Tax=Methylohalomonas lacus TaxID=398773 RepID=A0AAE3L1I5_9GAMM|nr:ABC transporter permease [Methylohalomonas lacus]MCS3904119.1 tungstate transport system permease protein [Methylohalomonas lacus]